MKTSKKIISIILALVLMTTMVTSAFYASACTSNKHDPYKEAATVLDNIDSKLDAYDVDLVKMLNGLVDGKSLVNTINGSIDEKALNKLLNQYVSQYLDNGQWLVDMGNEQVAKLLNQYLKTGVTDPLIKNLVSSLSGLIKNLPDVDELRALLPSINDLDKMIDEAVGAYINDGSKIIEQLDKLVADAIDGKLVYDSNGRKILKSIDGELAAKLDKIIEDNAGKYLNDGENLINLADEYIMNLLNTKEINGVPIIKYLNVSTLDQLVSQLVLADNSSVLQSAANALKGMFPDIQPTYESIMMCIIPILSAFDFGTIMANISDIAGMLKLASPKAFAYLAGLNYQSGVDENGKPTYDINSDTYFNTINESLKANGYKGELVTPIITLSKAQADKLMEFVKMENTGVSLSDIAAQGFNWTDYIGNTSPLDIANMFIKIDLGDASKLGSIAGDPTLGTALVNLLCDLLNDVKEAPVTTILKKLSDSKGLSAIAGLAMSLLNGDDNTFKSYELFSNNIYYDRDGNTTFYDKVVDGKIVYSGPKAMDQYVPVIAAALDFLGGIYDNVNNNSGDLLKTLLVDKLPQLKNLIKSCISYTDENGVEQTGMIAYLLDDYTTYLRAGNAILSYNVLIGLAEKSIEDSQNQIAGYDKQIATWQNYLDQVKPLSDAAKLAEAKKLGIIDESVTSYNEAQLQAAIEAKTAELQVTAEKLNAQLESEKSELENLQVASDKAQEASDEFSAWQDTFYDEPFYSDLEVILGNQDTYYIDILRDDCKADIDKMMGSGSFESLAADILANMADYQGDPDTFIDELIYNGGINTYAKADELDSKVTEANKALEDKQADIASLQKQADSASQKLADLESGKTYKDIMAAGDAKTIHISDASINAEGDMTAKDIEESINTIKTEYVAKIEANIAIEQAKISNYKSEQAESQTAYDNYDIAGLEMEKSALNNIVDSLMDFIGGNADMKSLYEYFNDGKIIEMLVAPDRVQALKKVFDSLITLFGDQPSSDSEYKTNLWKIEDLLFGTKGILTTFYTDFCKDPVLSIASRLAPLGEIVDIVYDMGFLQTYIKQYKKLIEDVTGLFGDDEDGFIALWKQAYTDGTANHHYTNAIISLLPNIVNIYDDLLEIPQIKDAVAPYADAVDFVLNLLSKNFYNDVMKDGFVETVLSDENMAQLQSIIDGIVVNLDNGEQIKQVVDLVFANILDGLYHDLLTNPVTAIAKRATAICNLVPQICKQLNVDISAYQYIFDDVKGIFDDNFSDDWINSKVTTLVDRVPALMNLINDVASDKNILGLIENNVPEEYKELVNQGLALLKSATAQINSIAKDLSKDYKADSLGAIIDRVPGLVDLVTAITGNEKLINGILAIDAVQNIQLAEGLTVGDIAQIIKSACKDITDVVAPELKAVLTKDTLNAYESDKLNGLLILVGGAANIVSGLAKDTALVNDILNLDYVKNIQLSEDMTVGDISGLIKTVVAMLPDILGSVDLASLLSNLETAPTKTVVELCQVVVKAIKALMGSKDPTVQSYVKQFKNTLSLVKDVLSSISVKGDKIVISFLSGKTPIDDLLSPVNIKYLKAAAKEVTKFVGNDDITKLVNNVLDMVDGLIEEVKSQPLLDTVENLGTDIGKIVTSANKIDGLADLIAPYNGIINSALSILKNIGKDADKSLVGAVLTRVDGIGKLINQLFQIDAIANIEVLGYKLSDFRSLINLVIKTLGGDFYSIYKTNPLKAIFAKIDNIKALYQNIKDLGILSKLDLSFDLGPVKIKNLTIFGYNILTVVDYVLPILDSNFYNDFEKGAIYALVAKGRLGRLEEALKNIIWYADIFSYSVNSGLCSAISGLCGVIDGLYEDLVLPTTPANGGNTQNSTARVIVSRLPQIQALLNSLKPLLGTNGKLINLTDVVSDTVKMEKDDILKMIAGVDMIKPYYYGISDLLDVIGSESAKYDWNTIPGIINAINGVGAKMVPTLKEALGVTDVKWVDLETPNCQYKQGGTAEDYLVEFSGQIGEGVLTPLVGTLLEAALTIPAVQDLVGEGVGAKDIAGLLNDLLSFDFKNDEVKFDAFNTEHLIYTAVNLVLPKTANANSPATADEIVMIVVASGTVLVASAGIYLTLKKRKKETVDVNAK